MEIIKEIKKFFAPRYINGDGCRHCKQKGFVLDGQFEGMCEIPCPKCRKENTYRD